MRFGARASALSKFLLSAMLLMAVGAHAQTAWTVTNFTDTSFATLETGGGFGPGVGSGSSGDLRYVLFHAMATGGVNTITFPGCTTTSPCTIVLGAPLPPIFETSNISSFSLTIDGGTQGAVIIDGNSGGANTTSGALTTNRVFFVDNVAVTLKNLVIQNAKAQGGAGGGGSSNGGGGGAGFGAGLFVNQSTAAVVVQNTTFTNCSVVGGAGANPFTGNGGGGGGGGLTFAGGNGSAGNGGGGGGVSGAGASASSGGFSGGSGGSGGGGGGGSSGSGTSTGGSAYADNASGGGGSGVSGGGNGGNGGFGSGGGGSVISNGGNGGFGGGGGGSAGTNGGNGGFGGGGGGAHTGTAGSSAAAVGGVQGGTGGSSVFVGGGGGGGAAAGPAIFVVNGSVTLYNTTGSGFTATAGAAGGSGNNGGGGGSTAGTASAVPVFNYGGTVNGSTSVGPVYNAFTVTEPVATASATQTATLTFTTAVTSSNTFTTNVLTQGATGLDFALVSGGTCASGTAYAIGATCTVEYSFTPTSPGIRYGGITLTSTSAVTSANPNGTVASTLISGIGTGPQVVFNAPLTPSTLGGGFDLPDGVAVDGSGNVYVADYGHNAVKVMSNTCTSSTCVSTLGGGFSAPPDVAVDGSGNVYISDYGNNAVKVMSNTCTSSTCVTTLGGGFSNPIGVAVDGSGNVYVADEGNNAVKVMSNTCTSSSCVSTLGGGFSKPFGVALDGSGNVYVADTFNSAVKVMANTCTSSSCVSTLGGGFYQPIGVAVDGSGNLYVADFFNGAVKVMSNTCTSSSCVSTLGGGFYQPIGVAVDGSGNLYVADFFNGAVKVMSNTCTSSSCVSTLGGGFYQPIGVAVDGSGNLYVADFFNGAVKVMSNTCTSSSCVSTLGGGFYQPIGVAVDGSGNLYVADSGNNAVKVMARVTPPTVAFATTTTDGTTDTTDGTQTVTVQNIGNATLSFAIPGSGVTNPTTPHDFTFTTTGGSACPSLTSSASTAGTLAAGATCNIPLTFTPVSPSSGALSESLIFTDTNLNATSATQSITLTGTAAIVPYAVTHFNGYVTNIALGSTTSFLIFLGNPSSTVALSNVSATVTLPAGFSYAGSTGGSCNVTPSSSGSTVTLSGISLAAGGSCQDGILLQATATGSQTVSTLPAAGAVNGTAVTSTVTVYTPSSYTAPTEPVGTASATQTAYLTFTTAVTSSNTFTTNVLTQGAPNLDFKLVSGGTCTSGTAYAIGATCTVEYSFTPTSAGIRYGGITLTSTSAVTSANPNGTVASTFISGIGTGPQVVFNAPLTPSTLGGGFGYPTGVAVDGSGNVYVADEGNNAVEVMANTCTSSSCVSRLGGGFNNPYDVAVDGSGNVYVADTNNSAVKVMPNTCASSSCVTTLGGGFLGPFGVAVDGSGNVYVADSGHSDVKVMANTCTSSSCVSTLGGGFFFPTGVAVDGSGNVYVADEGNHAVKVMSNTCTSSSCVSTLGGGFHEPYGVGVDGSGNVYVADQFNNAVKVMSNTCTSSSCVSTLGGGFSSPYGVGVDGSGNVYVADAGNNAEKVMARATLPTVAFATTTTDGTTDTTDGTQTVTLQNIGNAALSFAIPGSGITNPTTPHDFTFTTTGGSACPSLTHSASTTGSLAAGASCNIPLTFTPVSPANGALSESLTFTDTNLNATAATQTITLTGTAVPPTPASTANSTVAVSPSPAVAGSSVTVTATLKDAGGNAINGATASFSSTSTTASFGTPSVSGNVITVSMTDTAVETAPITITLGGNASGTLTGSAQFVAPAYVVTVNTDEASGNGVAANCVDPNISSSGNTNCSLRDAVAAADALRGVTANISFSLPNPSTIQIASGTAIQITQNVNLNGPGANALTVEGGIAPYNGTTQTANNRILQISGGNVNITGLTFANAYTGPGGSGAAINLYGSGGTLTVSNSVFSGNLATLNGGAINTSSALRLSNSTFSGNQSNSGNGGAINANSTLTVSNSTFSGNQSNSGGGGAIAAFSTLTVSNSTFSGNQSNGYSGGGGAINANSTLTMSNSTFSGNSSVLGGAIFSSGTLTVSNSIFSGDSASNSSGIYAVSGGTIDHVVYNGDTFHGVTPTSSISANPHLSALGYYGGPTQTLLPLPGSPAICGGVAVNGVTADQRGVTISATRYGQSGCYDIGAVQTAYALSFTTSPGNTVVGQTLSPTPLVTLSEDGTAFSAASESVAMSATTGTLSGTTTQSTSTTPATAGQASFPGLSISPAETADTLTAKMALTGSINLTATSASFNVTTVAASSANSTVVVSPSPAVAGSSVTVQVTVKDAGGNAINGATASFSSTSTTASFGTPSISGNVIMVSMTDTSVETAPITVTLGGNASGTLTGSAQFVAPAYVVTVATDPVSGNGTAANCVDPNISSSGNTNCSLRDAVAAADALRGVTANVSFSLPNPSTIQIASGTAIQITQNVNLNGPGANALTVEGGIAPYNGTTQTANNRILQISGGNVNITGLTFANAYSGPGGSGSAINLYGSGGPLTVSNSVFSGNLTTLNGGAINTSSALTVSGSTFSSNSATQNGGAIYTLNSLTVSNSTFSGNQTAATGGAIYQNSFNAGPLTVSNSTFSGNQASTVGGAIYTDQATFTITDNIFSGDSAPSDSGIFNNTGSGTASHNIFSGDTVSGVTPTNSISANPNLSALGNYGGTTQTLLPLPGSSAICAGTQPTLNSTPLTTDQRGVTISSTRYGQTGCYDIGAVQTEYSLGSAFTTQPPGFVAPGVAISPSPAVTVTENGLGVSGATVTMSAANGTVGGTTSATSAASTGLTTFSNLTITGALPGDDLVATLTLNSVPSPAIALTLTSSTFSSMSVSAPSTLTGQVGVAYSQSVSAAHGTAPYAYSITHGPLPAGLSLSSISGLISGTPTAGGSFSITVTATDSNGATASASFTLVISAATIVVSPPTLPTLTVGTAPTISFSASGGTSSYSYSLGGTSLPAGLTLNTSTGAVTGTPTTASAYSFTVTATDSSTGTGPYSGSQSYSGTVGTGSATVSFTSSTLSQTYTGLPLAVTATTNPTGLALTYSYVGTGSTTYGPSATPPTHAGTYNVTATINNSNYTGSAGPTAFTINKATPTITTAPTASSITYGAALSTSTLSGGVASTAGTFAWTNGALVPGAGTASYSVTFTPTDTTDYNTATLNVSITVNKATPTITTSPTASSITYGVSLSTSTLSGGVASTPGTFAWTNGATVPGAGTASYSVTFTPTDTTDYNTATVNVSLTVSKATPTISTAPTASSITYGVSLSTSTLSGGVASTPGTFAWTNGATVPGAGTASYSVTFTPIDTTDYNTATVNVSITVNKATPTITTAPTASSITYGAVLSTSTLSGGVASTAGTFAWTNGATVPGAGTASYSVMFTPTDITDYNTTTVNVSITVSKATPTITTAPTASPITYGAPLSTSTLSGGVASTAGTFAWTNGATVPGAGTASYFVTFTPTDTTDYNTTTVSVSLTVNKATPTITTSPTASSITYGAALSTSILSGGVASTAGTFAWTNGATVPGAGTASYSVTFTPTDTTDYSTATVNVSLTVSKATPIISTSPIASSITYGAALSTSTLSGGVASTAGTFAWTNGATVPDAGTASYSVTFTPTDTTDYNTTTLNVSITVSKATATVTLGNLTQTYTGSPLSATATTIPTGLSVSFTYNGGATAPTAAGNYTVVATVNDANYTGTAMGTLVISKATATVTLGNLTQTYTGSPLSATATTTPTGLSVTFTYNGSSTAPTAVGSYAVVATINNANYSGSASGTLVVSKATATVTLGSLAQTYSDSPLSATATTTPTGLSVSFTYNGIATAPTAIGSYAVVATVNDPNYSGTASGTLVISQAILTIKANNATKTYGTANPTFTGTVTGQQGSDTFTESFATTATTTSPVGPYNVVPAAQGTDLANYQQNVVNGTLTVTQAASITSVSVSSGAINPGQSVTLSAVVASTTTGTPTGTVNFYDGATLLGTASLISGTAAYNATTLAAGAVHTITAVYLGDTNFTGSTSASSVTVTVTPLDFTFTVTGNTAQNVVPGTAITYTFQLTPLYGNYVGPVSFTVTGLPAGATATFSPSSVAANGGPQTVVLTIQTPTTLSRLEEHGKMLSVSLALLLLPLVGLRKRRKAVPLMMALLLLMAAGTMALTGCGTNSNGYFGQPQKSYTITVTATSGTLVHTSTINLNVE